jgi:hypothetical protein
MNIFEYFLMKRAATGTNKAATVSITTTQDQSAATRPTTTNMTTTIVNQTETHALRTPITETVVVVVAVAEPTTRK